MNRHRTALMAVALACMTSPAFPQNQPTKAQIDKMLEPLRPAAEHQELAGLAGRWSQEVTYAMGGTPLKATGSVANRLVLGGRFLVSEGTSNNPSPFGDAAVEFITVYGFDRRTKQYTIVQFDTMGTYYVTAAGTKTPAGLILMSGETLEHAGGKGDTRKYDMTLRTVDANTYVSEIIFKFPGKPDQTIVSTTYRRIP
jgi:Protein of unknown function (DUF1579)